jgi:Asp-tRNA(Asn)/Glu-tRNA(Gln) amidotransferase C subunit
MSASDAEVRKVARLARLAIREDRIHRLRHQLAAVLTCIDRLRRLDVRVLGRWRTSARGRTGLTMMQSAPDTKESFITVPTVLGDGEGA